MVSIISGAKLKSLRQMRGLDRKALARAAGVDPSVVSRLERGLQQDVRGSVLVGIAGALDVPVDALLVVSREAAPSIMLPELVATMSELAHLPEDRQRQVAALLQAYLATTPAASVQPDIGGQDAKG
jgi:transcriptional regulator with XRE-family HTH domain